MAEPTIHTQETAPEASKPLLEKSVDAFGRVPNLHGVMATSPALLDAYQHLHALAVEHTAFTPEERTVVWMTVNVANECHYCVPAHTAIARTEDIDEAIISALRDETPLPSERLEALRRFALALRDTHGRPSAGAIADFRSAGFGERAMLDVIMIFAQKVMSNYTNAVFQTPVDAGFQKFDWAPPRMAAE